MSKAAVSVNNPNQSRLLRFGRPGGLLREAKIEGADRRYLEFETLTLAPIDLACIEPGLLTDAERQWLNDYHRRVRETVGPEVDEATRAWLAEATRAVALR